MKKETHIAIFNGKTIRRKFIGEKWFFSVVDVVGVLTESSIPKRYWSDLKIKLKEEGFESYDKIVQLKLKSGDGKEYLTDCADTEGIFRIIQSIPSKKAEPFKRWLAKVGYERIQEIENPELAQERMKEIYKKKGYSKSWIDKRLRGIAVRQDLTDEIAENMNWVFEDESVMAIEKLHGTNVSIIIQEGTVTAVFNRTERIPFINKGKKWIIEGLLNSKERGYLEFLGDGQFFGELIGPKVNGNPYKLKEYLWIPFSGFCQKHLKYKSWGKYPKDFKTISEWFKELIPLYSSMQGNREDGFVEGIVFTHPDGRMAKLRCDMFE